MFLEQIGKKVLPMILNGLKGIPDLLKNIWGALTSQPAKAISLLDSVTRDATVSDVNQVMQVFENYKDAVGQETAKVEQAVYGEVESFLDNLKAILESNKETLDKYHVRLDRIDRRMKRILSKINGSLDYEISKDITLSNPNCRRIMEMVPGTRKEQEMNEFLQNVLRDGLENLCGSLKDTLNDIFEELDEELPGVVEERSLEMKRCMDELENLNVDNYMEEKEGVMATSLKVLAGCAAVENMMEV